MNPLEYKKESRSAEMLAGRALFYLNWLQKPKSMKIEFTDNGEWSEKLNTIYDGKGFEICTVEQTAVLKDWELKGVSEWSEKPGETFIDRADEELEANIRLLKNAPRALKALNAIVNKFGSFKEVERLGITKEINEALEVIIAVTVPPKK